MSKEFILCSYNNKEELLEYLSLYLFLLGDDDSDTPLDDENDTDS